MRSSVLSLLAVALFAGSAHAAVGSWPLTNRYFDSITNATTFSGPSSSSTPTNGLGNLQTGAIVNLANFTPGVSQVSWMDVPVGNLTGAAIVNKPARLSVWLWQTISSSSTATDPFFSNVVDLGNGAAGPTFTANIASLSMASNSLSVFTINLPSFTIAPTTGNLLGLAFRWQIDNGSGFVSVAGLNTTVIGGATQAAPLVGTNAFSPPNGGYLRSADSNVDVNGQFAIGSVRNVGANSGVPFALYVPTPGAGALAALGGLLVTRRRRTA
jgi:hypothetical protein